MDTLTKHGRTYHLAKTSTLHLGRSPRHGDITTPAGTWPVEVTKFRGVAVRAGNSVRLDPAGAMLPDGPAQWKPGRHSAELTRDGARIVVRESGWFRKTATVEVSGAWADRDLVVLTACFAVLAQARRRQRTMIAVAAATSHG
ncbi:hypothetical protein [Cryptosporangium phraense]|uniref:Uncharacterized protein n=1 Tax=Cryptosporangium phraense TaxID=2593070 RepID=A0A545AW75_9ACTN|nr:hypothetical protein [Cryptosporangium phraense]TQS45582.1 hypothetical protein FL583_07575 [Cryptosporangium phraense]